MRSGEDNGRRVQSLDWLIGHLTSGQSMNVAGFPSQNRSTPSYAHSVSRFRIASANLYATSPPSITGLVCAISLKTL
ncbi:hypothetical protein LIA77_05300 [Sarocladium implicatum]|nr:hypothetical protein LIA77_05300 [Sarocladium implicatum]